MADSTPYHVTLKHPVAMKFSGEPRLVLCFDATYEGDVATNEKIAYRGDSTIRSFRVVKVWTVRGDGSMYHQKVTQTLLVPADNIAGLVAQPFDK